ncbi:MAG: diguanylate cyclase, partial [Clostridia bacterium]
MTREELNAAIIDETDNIVYVVDLETYELLYMNKRAIEHFGLKGDEAEKRPLCYKTFYGQDKPCEWCKNDIIMDKGRYSFRHYIEKINKYLYQKYRMITVGGRKAKLCITTDITELMETSKELEKQLYIEKTLVQCVSTLYCHDGADSAINHLLSIIANFHCAERAYIFEFDDSELIMSNTYEWCKEGTTAHIDELQRVEISKYNKWNRQLREKGEICIASLDDEVDNQSEEYRQLKKRNINSLMAVPLRAGEKIVGFMGVDNPTENMETHLLMQSAAAFVINDITRRKNLAKLHELSHVDRLTGVGNREAYVDYINSLEGKNTSVGIIFADINGLKKTNDAYGHKRGDRVISDAA